MKALNIFETAYRATIEEQDDTGMWLSYTLKSGGADADVLLRGNAVNYAVKGQDASGLEFGTWRRTHPPRLADDVASLISKGVTVYVVYEDLTARGLEGVALVEGLMPIKRSGLAKVLGNYDQVWHW